ncbi:MAG TPA: hypothetical protein VHW46_08575 [Terracidiphilus sp.]|nr:hypothetical protein [Terracidiphilus sp.]
MKNKLQWNTLGAVAFLGAGLVLAGCKSAPDLTQSQAQALIQTDYDHGTPQGISIQVNNDGMVQGAMAKYWNRTTIFPNKYWADFKLTDEGKKVVKLPDGGDKIEWRPESLDDKDYTFRMITVQQNHLRAHEVDNISDEMVAGVDTAKGADFTEGVDLTGVPDLLQQIAHNPGNKLSTKRHADFALVNGAWTVHSIQ